MSRAEPHRQRRAVLGPDAAARLDAATRWLTELGPAAEAGIVGATMQSAANLCRELGKRLGASFGWKRLTLARLAWTLADAPLAERGLLPVSGLAVEAVASRVVHVAASRRELGRFAPIADRPGLPRALARTFTEVRLEGRGPSALGDPDLARLLEHYEAELAHARLADRAELFHAAAEVARAGHDALGIPMLFVDVPIRAAREVELVRVVLERAPRALFTVPEGDDRTRRALARIDVPFEASPADARTALGRLKTGLFREVAEKPEVAEGVHVFSAPGESRECVELARLIHREAEHGVPFDRIAVLLRSPHQYRAHLQEAFRRAGIPPHFARGTARPDPAGRAFLSLLACAAEQLSAVRFAEFLSLGEVPDATPEGKPPAPLPSAERWVPADDDLTPARLVEATGPRGVRQTHDVAPEMAPKAVTDGTLRAPRLWERLLVDAAVIGGLERWQKRLSGLREEMAMKLAELKDPDEPHGLALARDQAALRDLQAYALPLLEDLAALPNSAPWGDWLDRLGGLATRALRQPDRVLAVLAELAPMAEVGPVGLSEVRVVLEPRLTHTVVPPSEQRFGKVFVASTEEARGLAFDVVFVPGLAEKLFPHKVTEDPVLPDRTRKELGLATNADRAADERLALRIAVGAATRKVVVSYPRLDLEQSRPRTPSFYGLEVLRAAEGELPGFDDLARRANVAGAARVGWPAPVHPRDAIDHAEHDLALLDGVLRRPEAESIGMARYLLASNAHLARALRSRANRWLRKWTPADGLVSPGEEARVALARHALDARSYSPTGLQNFAACPYRFVLQAIHRLAPREELLPLEELDPLQKGSLIHEVEFLLHLRLREQGLLPVSPTNLDEARDNLDTVLEEVARSYKERLAPAIERVWDDSVAGIRADLREWLRRSSEGDDAHWTPRYFELSFGLGQLDATERDPNSTSDPLPLDCGIRLRGSIDLVEENAAHELRATDYKTGKVRASPGDIIQGGAILQPVFYALALEKLLPDRKVEGGRLYYCTTVGEFTPVPVDLDARARDAATLVAKTVEDALTRGFLPAAPEAKACEYCDYLRVCGPYEEERTGRKKKDELALLTTLRKHP